MAGGACVGAGIGPRHIDRVIGIAKGYVTRVGAGPFPTEMHGAEADYLVELAREYGSNTGRRRRVGWFDAVMMRQAIRLSSISELALGKIDKLDTFPTVKVCVAYEIDGRCHRDLPYHQSELHRAVPVYEELPGWQTDLSGAFEPSHLPKAARDFIDLIAEQARVPVHLVGVGPGREQFVHLASA